MKILNIKSNHIYEVIKFLIGIIIFSKVKFMKILKIHQKEYYQSENAMNYNDEIQKIILNLLDDVNICELNSYILSIFFDNLLNEDSKISFEFFQVFSQNKARLPFIVFLAKKIILKELFYSNCISIDIFI